MSRKFSLSFLALMAGSIYYPQSQAKFQLYFQENKKNREVFERCPTLKYGYFYPTIYLGNGWLQGHFGVNAKEFDPQVKYTRQFVDLKEFGEFGLDWAFLENPDEETKKKIQMNKDKLVIVLAGFTASKNEPYIVNMISQALKEGYTVMLYNDRVYNNQEFGQGLWLPKDNHFCFIDDFRHIMKYIKENIAGKYKHIYGVGHSFGANTLVRYLGEHPDENFLEAAVSVSNPWDLSLAGKLIGPAAEHYLLQARKDVILRNRHLFESAPERFKIDVDLSQKAKNSSEFDIMFTRAFHGVASNEVFYRQISSVHKVMDVKIPLLCLQARDDPMIHYDTIPVEECKVNENVMLLVTNTGGHVGWFEGLFSPKRWYMKPTMEFLNAHNPDLMKAQPKFKEVLDHIIVKNKNLVNIGKNILA